MIEIPVLVGKTILQSRFYDTKFRDVISVIKKATSFNVFASYAVAVHYCRFFAPNLNYFNEKTIQNISYVKSNDKNTILIFYDIFNINRDGRTQREPVCCIPLPHG